MARLLQRRDGGSFTAARIPQRRGLLGAVAAYLLTAKTTAIYRSKLIPVTPLGPLAARQLHNLNLLPLTLKGADAGRMNSRFRLSGRMGGPLEKSFFPSNGKPIGGNINRRGQQLQARYRQHRGAHSLLCDLTFYNETHIERLESSVAREHEIHIKALTLKDIWDSKTLQREDGVTREDSRVTYGLACCWIADHPADQQGSRLWAHLWWRF